MLYDDATVYAQHKLHRMGFEEMQVLVFIFNTRQFLEEWIVIVSYEFMSCLFEHRPSRKRITYINDLAFNLMII